MGERDKVSTAQEQTAVEGSVQAQNSGRDQIIINVYNQPTARDVGEKNPLQSYCQTIDGRVRDLAYYFTLNEAKINDTEKVYSSLSDSPFMWFDKDSLDDSVFPTKNDQKAINALNSNQATSEILSEFDGLKSLISSNYREFVENLYRLYEDIKSAEEITAIDTTNGKRNQYLAATLLLAIGCTDPKSRDDNWQGAYTTIWKDDNLGFVQDLSRRYERTGAVENIKRIRAEIFKSALDVLGKIKRFLE